MTNHKYLIDLGMKPSEIMVNLYEPDENGRESRWQQQQSIYGFDERETWGLDDSFYQWLYERLMMFIDVNCINLDFHTFEYRGEEKTQRELIDLMLEYLRIPLLDNMWDFDTNKIEKVAEIAQIWALVLPAMWW